MKIELHEEIEINGEDVPCTVVFECSGVWDPGVLSGPPEHCYPPEGPEIEFVGSYIERDGVTVEMTEWPQGWLSEMEDKAAEEYAEWIKGEA